MDEQNPWDLEPIDEEEDQPARPVWLRVLLVGFGVLTVLIMLAVPLLQVGVWSQGDPPSAEERVCENTAVIFTAALLQRRSPRLAMRVADQSVQEQVDAIAQVIDGRDPRDLDDARVSLRGTSCAGLPDRSHACYEATLRNSSGLPIVQFRFGVALSADGSAEVIGVLPGFRSI